MFVPAWPKSRLPIPKSPCKNGNSSYCPAVILNKMGFNAVLPAEDAERSTDPSASSQGRRGGGFFSLGRGVRRNSSGQTAVSPLCLCSQAAPPPLAEPEGLSQNPREARRSAGR